MKKNKEEGYDGMRIKSSVVSTVISIMLVLIPLGMLSGLVYKARYASEKLRESIHFRVELSAETSQAVIDSILTVYNANPAVHETKFISKEEAAEIMKQEVGEDVVTILGYNPLPPVIDVCLNSSYTSASNFLEIEQALYCSANVVEVAYQRPLIESLNENINRLGLILSLIVVVLLIISISLINNTMRLALFSKRFIIKTMLLVGATRWFVCKPFMWRGFWQGFAAAVLFGIVAAGMCYYGFLHGVFEQSEIPTLILLASGIGALGVFFSTLCSFLAVRKYIRMKEDNLYQ